VESGEWGEGRDWGLGIGKKKGTRNGCPLPTTFSPRHSLAGPSGGIGRRTGFKIHESAADDVPTIFRQRKSSGKLNAPSLGRRCSDGRLTPERATRRATTGLYDGRNTRSRRPLVTIDATAATLRHSSAVAFAVAGRARRSPRHHAGRRRRQDAAVGPREHGRGRLDLRAVLVAPGGMARRSSRAAPRPARRSRRTRGGPSRPEIGPSSAAPRANRVSLTHHQPKTNPRELI
jgi:hypothetical protein